MDPDLINDVRLDKDFRNVTFSKFQKSKAKGELIKSIYNCKIENACYWSAEFICSGHFLELWDIIIFYYCKYIHIGNPKLAIYLDMRFKNFLDILNSGYSANTLVMRNNKKIRRIFGEIVCMLCYSFKKHTYDDVKLNKNEEFDLTIVSSRFKAPSVKYADIVFKDDDPKELFIPINELIYNLEIKNVVECCYWYEWILEYEMRCIKKKKKCACQGRLYAPAKFQNDIVWLVWDIIFHFSNPNPQQKEGYNMKNVVLLDKIVQALFALFTIKFCATFKRKRKYVIYYCFSLLTETFDSEVAITSKSREINAILEKIDAVYREIKKNEQSPKTDYLYTNLKKSNAEKTFEKLELITQSQTQSLNIDR